MGKAIIHEEIFWVIKRGNRYMTTNTFARISPLDATRFYNLEHAMTTITRWEGYKNIKIVKCQLTVREQ